MELLLTCACQGVVAVMIEHNTHSRLVVRVTEDTYRQQLTEADNSEIATQMTEIRKIDKLSCE